MSTQQQVIDANSKAADPGTLFVPSRLLRRIIKRDRGLTGFGLRVPHRKCYVINREKLLAFVDRDELGIDAKQELPDSVILLPKADGGDDNIAAEYPRLQFHAQVHQAFAQLPLSEAELRSRIHRIGQAAFDEIRSVLRQEKRLLPPRDDRTVYEEFVATYLELRQFSPELLPAWFPALDEFSGVDAVIDGDLQLIGFQVPAYDCAGPKPKRKLCHGKSDAHLPSAPIRQGGERPEGQRDKCTNDVRALMTAQSRGDQDEINCLLQKLSGRLQAALELTPEQVTKLDSTLPALVAEANESYFPAELRILFDLQNACVDFERPVAAPNLTEWIYSRFRRPFVCKLPDQPYVQATRHLRRAISRLHDIRIDTTSKYRLQEFLESTLLDAEIRLRTRIRPVVTQSLSDVGFNPQNFPERVAKSKVVEELLDRVVERGYLRIGDLRDAISRNQLKLPDLGGLGEWFRGDALLRANGELAARRPGFYRRGEIYLRWLQRGSAAMFGTRIGRWLTLNLLAPFGGAFLAVEGPFQIVHEVKSIVGGIVRFFTGGEHVHHHTPFPLSPWWLIGLVGVFFWLLLHVAAARNAATQMAALIGRTLRTLLIDAPVALFRWTVLQKLLSSAPVRLLMQLIVKPAVPAALIWWALPWYGIGTNLTMTLATAMFIVVLLFVNSRLGRDAEDAAADWLARRWRLIRFWVPGLFGLIIDAFKQLMEWLDRGLYAVDEWLRFRQGESWLTLAWKTVAGAVWNLFAYVVRFVMVLFVEPQVNPIKHFPVVTISHKLLLPMIPAMTGFLMDRYGFGKKEAGLIATLIIGKIPGVFGFLVWELKENWRLYASNRPAALRPVLVGHHGETVARLLRPGLHSGTIPKLFGKLRRAERKNDQRRSQRHFEALHHNEEAIRHFVERELAAHLSMCPSWPHGPVHVPSIHVGTNRIRIELACPSLGDGRAILCFEEQSGWLLGGILDAGWTTKITPVAGQILWLASRGFCKTAGIDLLREQIGRGFSDPNMRFDVAGGRLIVWPDDGFATECWYDLNETPKMHSRPTEMAQSLPTLDADEIEFRLKPIYWTEWVARWSEFAAK